MPNELEAIEQQLNSDIKREIQELKRVAYMEGQSREAAPAAPERGFFKYTEFKRGPIAHQHIAFKYISGLDVRKLASLYETTPDYIRKILNHPPVRHEIEQAFEKVRVARDQAKVEKIEIAQKGFAHVKDIVDGAVEPNKTRFEASKLAMEIDPLGRYDKPDHIGDREPFDSDSLREYLDKAAAIDAKFTVADEEPKSHQQERLTHDDCAAPVGDGETA